MGLFDFIKGEFIEVIDWVEQDNTTMLWKFPDRDANIKNGAQLTVRESQEAIFLDEGIFADVFPPGRHKLYTQNLPILTSMRNWDKAFKSPFKCDVYFLSTKVFSNLKWGTTNPVMIRDPEFKQVRVKAHGVYFVKVKDAKQFFKSFAGTGHSVSVSDVETAMRDVISPTFAEALGESGVSVLDLVSNYTELGDKIAPIIQKELDQFGIELTKFQISSTGLPKEVEAFYDKMTNMNMVDDMNKFTQFQSANALEKAAENPGGTGDGLGMGMGMGMAQMMMNQQNQAQQNNVKKESKEEIMKALKDLGELKNAGILTEEEFSAKKKDLLDRL